MLKEIIENHRTKRRLINIEEWVNNHTTRAYLLVDCDGTKEGEGYSVIRAINPKAFKSIIRELPNPDKCIIIRGKIED